MTRNELKQLVKDCLKSTTKAKDLKRLIQNMKESDKFEVIVDIHRFKEIEEILEDKLGIAFNDDYIIQYQTTLGDFLNWLIEAMD
jgi:hypothetical protein